MRGRTIIMAAVACALAIPAAAETPERLAYERFKDQHADYLGEAQMLYLALGCRVILSAAPVTYLNLRWKEMLDDYLAVVHAGPPNFAELIRKNEAAVRAGAQLAKDPAQCDELRADAPLVVELKQRFR